MCLSLVLIEVLPLCKLVVLIGNFNSAAANANMFVMIFARVSEIRRRLITLSNLVHMAHEIIRNP